MSLLPGGLLAGAGAFGGETAFGFEIPQGDPGELDAAAQACARQASLLDSRAGEVSTAARIASGAWAGRAEQSFASYAGHVISVFHSNSAAFGAAGQALSTLAQALEAAQQATSQALGDCEASHQDMVAQQQAAADHQNDANTLRDQAAAAPHPHVQANLRYQAEVAAGLAADAGSAASAANDQLEAAQRRGIQAWQRYEHEAQAAARAIGAAAGGIELVSELPGGAGPALTADTKQQGAAGFWPAFNSVAASDGTAAAIGTGEGILERYRKPHLVLAKDEDTQAKYTDWGNNDFRADVGDDPLFTRSASGLLFVPKGSSADPMVQKVITETQGEGNTVPGKPLLTVGADDLKGASPEWADVGGRALGVAGVGLTLYSSGATQWASDSKNHPGWSTAHKVADTAQTTAVVGGLTAGGALVGAETGAEAGGAIGMAVGSVIPVIGTGVVGAGGAIIGGVIGGVVGSKLGSVAGHGVEDLGHDAVHVGGDAVHEAGHLASGAGHTVSHVWHSIFG